MTSSRSAPPAPGCVRELEPHVGDSAQQNQAIAAAAHIRKHGEDLLAAARHRQDTELAAREVAAPALQQATQDAHRDVDRLTDDLAKRPDAIGEPALEPSPADRLVGTSRDDYHDRSVDGHTPDRSRDIEP